MTMWLVRAGKTGEREALALENQVAVIGWEELPDLTPYATRSALDALMKATYPNERPKTLSNWHGQLWAVREVIKAGDVAVLPLKTRPTVALGIVSGGYCHRDDLPGGPFHARPVAWVAEVPRRAFDVDILLSFGAFMTVCRIERNDAEQRVRALLAEGGGGAWPVAAKRPAALPRPAQALALALANIEERSHDMIRERIAQKFKGHQLASLVAALLEAQGYRARVSPPGPDGGVDILAGNGPLGFDAPRLVVQVKSQDAKVDVRLLRELAGGDEPVPGRPRAAGWLGRVQPAGAGRGRGRLLPHPPVGRGRRGGRGEGALRPLAAGREGGDTVEASVDLGAERARRRRGLTAPKASPDRGPPAGRGRGPRACQRGLRSSPRAAALLPVPSRIGGPTCQATTAASSLRTARWR